HVLSMRQKVLARSVLYIEFPNNPFGVIDPALFRQVVDYVVARDGSPFADLAFGEALGDEFRQTIQYTLDKGGVCIGSLSKMQRLGLEVGPTDLRTPIQVVLSHDAHFHRKLSQQGLVTESLRDYEVTVWDGQGYNDAAVRMLTPRPGQLEEVLRRVHLALHSD